jgi:hypothetical protein
MSAETAAIVSSSIAVVSILVNIYLAYSLRSYQKMVTRKENLRSHLFNLKHSLDNTSLLTVTPHYEVWECGFKSLEELRKVAVGCYVIMETAPSKEVPGDLKDGVGKLVDAIKELYRYRDSYTRYSQGKMITSREKIEAWPDFENAKHALTVLQGEYRRVLPMIENQLRRMY